MFASHSRTCTCGQHAAAVDSRENWQKRLWWTGISKPGRDAVVSLENDLVDAHAERGDAFADRLLEIHSTKGYISSDDLIRALHESLEGLILDSEDRYIAGGEQLGVAAVDQAYDRVGVNPVIARTNRLLRFNARRLGAVTDDFGDRISDNIQSSFTRVKSLPADVVAEIQDKLRDAMLTGASTEDVLRTMIDRYIDQADPAALREALKEIWGKTKTDLQRVIRMETINAYSKAQLQEWYNQGAREIYRNCINDFRTCATCRELARPGHNVYRIEDLLRLEHPVTDDPNNPGQWLSHIQCRCWFTPRLDDIWTEIEDLERDVFADIGGPEAMAYDVPLDAQQPVSKILKELKAPEEFRFVEDVTTLDSWQQDRLRQLEEEDPATARARLDEEIRAGGVLQWTDAESGLTYVSDQAQTAGYVTLPFARREAEVFWRAHGSSRPWWQKRFDAKMAEADMTLEKNGVQVFGGLPFFTPAAAASAEAYFVEAYAHYMVDPVLLVTFDPPAFERLKDTVFGGQDFTERGGVN